MSSGLRFRVYESGESLPQRHRALFDAAEKQSFFLGLDWFDNFTRTALLPTEKAVFYAVEDGDDPLLVLPAKIDSGSKPMLEPRELRGMASFYSCLFAPVAAPGIANAAEAFKVLFLALKKEVGNWDVVKLNPMPVDQAVMDAAEQGMKEAGLVTERYFSFGNWYRDTAGLDYATLASGFSSVITNNIKRVHKQWITPGKATMEMITGGEALERGIRDYTTIYNHTWKKPEPFEEFIPSFMRLCARRGWLRLGMMYVDGEPAATHFWIVNNGVASNYKGGYDERFSKLSSGTVLTAFMFQYVLDNDHVRQIDYLTGDDDYKKVWLTHRRERWGLQGINPATPLGALAAARTLAAHAVKKFVKPAKSEAAKAKATTA